MRHLMISAVAQKAGVYPSTMQRWRNGSLNPHLNDLEACLNAIGLALYAVPVEPKKRQDVWTHRDIQRAADKWNNEGKTSMVIAAEMDVSINALHSIIRRHRHLFNRRNRGYGQCKKQSEHSLSHTFSILSQHP